MFSLSLGRTPRRRCLICITVAALAGSIGASVSIATPPECQTRWLDGVPTSDISYSGSYVGGVRALTMWDPDGDGPEPERLVAGGAFDTIGGIGSPQVAMWVPGDRSFTALGSGFTGPNTFGAWVSAVASVPNAAGGNDLYAAGVFTRDGDTTLNGIARWNGTSWTPLGEGIFPIYTTGQFPVSTMVGCRDGSLVMVGYFSRAGNLPATGLARWDGASWSIPATVAGGVLSTVACLPDNSLIIGGSFTSVNGEPIVRVARILNGVATPMGGEQIGSVSSLAVTPNGTVFATTVTASGTRVVQYDDGTWAQIGAVTSTASSNPGAPKIFALADNTIALVGSFTAIDGVPMSNLARYNGASWEPFGPLESPNAAAQLPDGRIVTARTNLQVSEEQLTSSLLGPVPQLTNGTAYAVEYFEGDLIVAGIFTSIQDNPATNIARRTANGWEQMGSLQGVTDLFNRNGTLYAAGWFEGHVARWTGEQWVIDMPAQTGALNGEYHLAAHEGSLVLTYYDGHSRFQILTDTEWIALPSFRTIRMAAEIASHEGHLYAGGRAGNLFQRLDGMQWSPVQVIGTQPTTVTGLAEHEGRLYICFATSGEAYNSPSAWTVGYMESGSFFEVGRIALPIRAFVATHGGDLYAMSERTAMYRIRDESIDIVIGGVRDFDTLLDLSQLATDSHGRIAFVRKRSYGGSDFAEFLDPRPVALRDVPAEMLVCDDGRAEVSVRVLGTLDRTLRWEWDGGGEFAPIADGFVAGLGLVSSSATDALFLDQADPAALGTHVRLFASDACNAATSAAIMLVQGASDTYACARCSSCPNDYNQDGSTDGADLAAFFADFELGLPCADMDRDGGVDGGDIGAFFAAFETGAC